MHVLLTYIYILRARVYDYMIRRSAGIEYKAEHIKCVLHVDQGGVVLAVKYHGGKCSVGDGYIWERIWIELPLGPDVVWASDEVKPTSRMP